MPDDLRVDLISDTAVAHTIRRGQLRFAVHAYNNESDIERAIACVREATEAKWRFTP